MVGVEQAVFMRLPVEWFNFVLAEYTLGRSTEYSVRRTWGSTEVGNTIDGLEGQVAGPS